MHKNNRLGDDNNKTNTIINPSNLETVLRENYKEGTKKNPFSNVLLTDIGDDPKRKSAPPSFNVDVDEDDDGGFCQVRS